MPVQEVSHRELAARIDALESEVACLKATLLNRADEDEPTPGWWITTAGRFHDDPDFDEAIRVGREERIADRTSGGNGQET